MRTRSLILIALFAALTVVSGRIVVPLGPVPFTLQYFFVALAGLLLGARDGALAQLVYILVGLSGVPVFSFGGGPGSFAHPTFGFIVGFLACAWCTGAIGARSTSLKRCMFASLVGLAVLYMCGVPWLWFVMNVINGVPMAFSKALVTGCLVFLPMDFLKAVVLSMLASRISTQWAVTR